MAVVGENRSELAPSSVTIASDYLDTRGFMRLSTRRRGRTPLGERGPARSHYPATGPPATSLQRRCIHEENAIVAI